MRDFDLRPFVTGEILDAAFKLYRSHFVTLMKISAVIIVPLGLIQVAVALTYGNIDLLSFAEAPADEIPAGFAEFFISLAITGIVVGLGTLLIQGASITVFGDAYGGTQRSWTSALSAGLRRLPQMLVAAIATFIGATVGLLFCILPGVWLWTSWSTSIHSVVLEHKGPFAAMATSFRRVRLRFWPVLGIVVLAYLIRAIADQLVGFAVNMAFFFSSIPSLEANPETFEFGGLLATATVASLLVLLVIGPLQAAIITVMYFDLRVRQEGYDLELLAAEVESAIDRDSPLPATTSLDQPADGQSNPFGLDDPT